MASVQVLENYIDGRFVPCSRHVDSYNPALGEVHLKVPDSGDEEVQLAVEAAQRAFKKYERYVVLRLISAYCVPAEGTTNPKIHF